jgi:arylsulfatase
VNGVAAGSLPLDSALRERALDLPASLLVPGANRLALRYAGGGGNPGSRVVWDWLRLRPERPAGQPALDPQAGGVRLPLGAEASWFLELAAGSVLRLDGIEAPRGGRLRIALQEDGAGERELGSWGRRGGPLRLPLQLDGLAGGERRLARLSLRADGDPARRSEILVRRPRVHAPATSPAEEEPPAAGPGERPHLIVYLIDTLRADRLGCYGSQRGLTPHLDAFAAQARLYERAWSASTWTRPAVATLLTGLAPLDHGVVDLEDRLSGAAETLAERLRAAGYRTAALSTNWHVSPHSGMRQGFEDFLFVPDAPHPEEVVERLRSWLDGAAADGSSFFLYVHALDPHAPYEPPPDLRRRFAPASPPEAGSRAGLLRAYGARGAERRRRIAELAPLYDAEVAWADRGFGAFLELLRQRGLYERSLVVVLADHGEELGERGELGHARDLYCETLAIPLLVKPPRAAAGRRVAEPAGMIDVAPTLLRAAGLPAGELPGRDLLALAGSPPRTLVAHLAYERRRALSAVRGPWQLVLPLAGPRAGLPELYDLGASPAGGCGESANLARARPVRAGFLESALRLELQRSRPRWERESSPVDEEARRALRALGYQ